MNISQNRLIKYATICDVNFGTSSYREMYCLIAVSATGIMGMGALVESQ